MVTKPLTPSPQSRDVIRGWPLVLFQMGQPIRLLLAYTDIDYEERVYEMGDGPDFDKSDWLKDKFSLGLGFPNLPYYIEGIQEIVFP